MPELLVTPDIWQGALLLVATNARLVDIQLSRNGRETIMFTFRGENLSRTAKAYCNQEAVANVTELRVKINELRDVIFQSRKNN